MFRERLEVSDSAISTQLTDTLSHIPLLPTVIRYYDDFADEYRSIPEPKSSDCWNIQLDGRSISLEFTCWDQSLRGFIKTWCADLLCRRSPRTVEFRYCTLKQVDAEIIKNLLTVEPSRVQQLWKMLQARLLPHHNYDVLKSILHFLCVQRIAAWSPDWIHLISQLPLPRRDKYASVRLGNVFLTAEEEAAIVRHIDDVVARMRVADPDLSDDLLLATIILVCSYQYGMRPKQIAMLRMRDVKIWNDGTDQLPAVHLTFTMIKQRWAKRVFPMVRKVKREWSPLFVLWYARAQKQGMNGGEHLFSLSPQTLSVLLVETLECILGQRRTATELRHTAAQRLVDAGATEEELAAFMGHTDLDTALVYFQSSASQAERVNQALGLSPVYQRVTRIAHDRFISMGELAELKGEQQIGGVPHGIPITGIGGCSSGQPACPYSPVMSCYGCRKFMPVNDPAIHIKVLVDLRGIVKLFYESSRDNASSPAYLQLRHVIDSAQAILEELEGRNGES